MQRNAPFYFLARNGNRWRINLNLMMLGQQICIEGSEEQQSILPVLHRPDPTLMSCEMDCPTPKHVTPLPMQEIHEVLSHFKELLAVPQQKGGSVS